MIKISKYFFLIIILSGALFLRIWNLNKVPPGLFGDEIDVGYQAYSLLKTGKDYRGNLLPVYIDSLAESRAPLLMYATVPFIKIFGLNEWGVRLVSVFFGILSILVLFLIVKELFDNQFLAIITALLMAVTPWHIAYSRTTFEVSLLLFLILFGTLSFLRGLKGKLAWIIISVISFSLSFYVYNTANIFVPLWLLILIIINFREIIKIWPKFSSKIIFSLILGLLIIFPLGREIISGSAANRFRLVSAFSDAKTIDTIIFKRSIASPGSVVERIFHNKVAYWVKNVSANYLESISFKFLFVNGDPNPRHSIPGFGYLFLSFLPFTLLGIFQFVKEKKTGFRLVLFWLLIAPIASSLTTDGGSHGTRLILMIPPLMVMTAYGVVWTVHFKWGKFLLSVLAMTLIFELFFYLHELMVHYPNEQFRYWNYGYKEIILSYKKNQDVCQTLYINNSHDPFLISYLFWSGIDPAWFQQKFTGDKNNLVADNLFLGFKLAETYFGRIVVPDKIDAIKKLVAGKKACYIAFQEDEIPGDWDLQKNSVSGLKVLELVKNPWGKPYIYLLRSD